MDEIISKEDYKIKYTEIESKIEELSVSIKSTENNEDLKAIDNVIANIDIELDEYINTQKFEENKIEWFIEHTQKVSVEKVGEGREPQKRLYMELDLLAGAIIGADKIISL